MRQWEEGKALVLDGQLEGNVEYCALLAADMVTCFVTDAFDHEVWHNGKQGDRVLLLFDFWHPDLVQGEREAIAEMFKGAKEKGWLKDYE